MVVGLVESCVAMSTIRPWVMSGIDQIGGGQALRECVRRGSGRSCSYPTRQTFDYLIGGLDVNAVG